MQFAGETAARESSNKQKMSVCNLHRTTEQVTETREDVGW